MDATLRSKLGALSTIATQNHGIFTVRDMKAVNISSSTVSRHVQQGLFERIGPSTYRFCAVPHSFESAAMGAAMSVQGVVSHLSAAELWGLNRVGDIDAMHVTIAPERLVGAIKSRPRWLNVHRRELPDTDVVTKDGIPVTTVARTLRDIAWLVNPRSWSRIQWYWRLIDDALDAALVKLADLEALFRATNPRCPYSKAFRTAIAVRAQAYVRTESLFERRFVAAAHARTWDIETQVRFDWRRNCHLRSDVVIRKAKLIVELDGRRGHSSLSDREADRRRDLEALQNGWVTVRIGWNEFTHERDRVMSDLAMLIHQRGSPLRQPSGLVQSTTPRRNASS